MGRLGPDLSSQHPLRHQGSKLGAPNLLTWRPEVPAVDTGFPSFSHISMGLGVPVALQVSRTGAPSSTGPGRLGGSVMRGGTAGQGDTEHRLRPPEGETRRAPGWAPPQATNKGTGTATPFPSSQGCSSHPFNTTRRPPQLGNRFRGQVTCPGLSSEQVTEAALDSGPLVSIRSLCWGWCGVGRAEDPWAGFVVPLRGVR